MRYESAESRPALCLNDLVLDRLLAGELDPSSEAALHLGVCARCSARLAALRADAHNFVEESFISGLAAQTRWRARRRSPPLVALVGVVATAAALLLYVRTGPPEPGLRTKGGGALELVVRHADGRVEPVLPATRLHPGEAVRFIVSAEQAGHLAIVGADARPAATAYLPESGSARPIAAGRRQLVERSVVLDDTLGAERLIAVICARPLPVADIVAAARQALARAGGDPRRMEALALDCRQLSFVIEKTPAP